MNLHIRPTLIPTLFTIPALIVLLSLGTWQLQRLAWKNTLIHSIDQALKQPTVLLPNTVDNPSSLLYRKITVTGEFQYDKEIYLYTGTRQYRGEQGYDIFTPLKRTDGSYVLVDRGWVPIEKKLPEKRPETLVKGLVTIEGSVLLGEQKKFFTPLNETAKNLWFWIDLAAMKHSTGFDFPNFYIMAAENSDPHIFPQGRNMTPNIRNDHLQYAITWYSAALALIVIYVLYHRKRG